MTNIAKLHNPIGRRVDDYTELKRKHSEEMRIAKWVIITMVVFNLVLNATIIFAGVTQ